MKEIKGATFRIENAVYVDKTTGEKKEYSRYWVYVNDKLKFQVAPKSKEALEVILNYAEIDEVE